MGKGHYRGGGTLIGIGPIVKAKGRSGGIGTSGAAVREEQRLADRKRQKKVNATIKANEGRLRELGKKWAAEKGQKHYDRLLLDERVKSSPLAAALDAAIKRDDTPSD